MDKISYFENLIKNPEKIREMDGELWTMYDAYAESSKLNSPILNFNKNFNADKIPTLIEQMKRFGIGEFGISYKTMMLQEIAMGFCSCGCIITGIMDVPIPDEREIGSAPSLVFAVHY